MPLKSPKNVFLFSGHMIDAHDRRRERFPADLESLVTAAISNALDTCAAGRQDIALCQGACGGDLIFARLSLDRGMRLELRLPFDEPVFLEKSVRFAGRYWIDRYFEVKANPRTRVLAMPEVMGPTMQGEDSYEKANLWLLADALAFGAERLRFLALWNGKDSGKRGGTGRMIAAVQEKAGKFHVIDLNKLLLELRAAKPGQEDRTR